MSAAQVGQKNQPLDCRLDFVEYMPQTYSMQRVRLRYMLYRMRSVVTIPKHDLCGLDDASLRAAELGGSLPLFTRSSLFNTFRESRWGN